MSSLSIQNNGSFNFLQDWMRPLFSSQTKINHWTSDQGTSGWDKYWINHGIKGLELNCQSSLYYGIFQFVLAIRFLPWFLSRFYDQLLFPILGGTPRQMMTKSKCRSFERFFQIGLIFLLLLTLHFKIYKKTFGTIQANILCHIGQYYRNEFFLYLLCLKSGFFEKF